MNRPAPQGCAAPVLVCAMLLCLLFLGCNPPAGGRLSAKPAEGTGCDLRQNLVDAFLPAQMTSFPASFDTATFHLRFVLIGEPPFRCSREAKLGNLLQANVAKLNQFYQPYLRFTADEDFDLYPDDTLTISEAYRLVIYEIETYRRWVGERLVGDFEKQESESSFGESLTLTVFVLPNSKSGSDQLLGFCPVLMSGFDWYNNLFSYAEQADAFGDSYPPNFEHICLSIAGLEKQTTLAHEIGHWLGLTHTFEMTSQERSNYGLHDEAVLSTNLMNYVPKPTSLTTEQKARAWQFAWTHRAYFQR